MGPTSIRVLYVIAGLLEVAGIAMIVGDVRAGRARAQELLKRPRRTRIPWPTGTSIHTTIENEEIRQGGPRAGEILRQRAGRAQAQVQRLARGAATAELELVDELVKILGGSLFRKLLGPGLLVAGVIVGTIANIANT